VLDWWSSGRLIGGMSPNFAMAAFGLYGFFLILGIAAASLATAARGLIPAAAARYEWLAALTVDGQATQLRRHLGL